MDFAALPLARTVLDRAVGLRDDPDGLRRACRDPATRVIVVGGGEVLLDEAAATVLLDSASVASVAHDDEPVLLDPASVAHDDEPVLLDPASVAGDGGEPLLLGRATDTAGAPLVFARRVPPGTVLTRRVPRGPASNGSASNGPVSNGSASNGSASGVPGLRWATLREVGSGLAAQDAGLATVAVALDQWHTRHPYCSRCGARTVPARAGWVRVCPADGVEHYPRTDPAIIVAVTDDDDRLLLGHNAAWPAGRFSTLAGFVEAGESAEHAVLREVREETAVVIDRLDYRGSQPWPFPGSLMLAYRAHAAATAVAVDGVELTGARWFTRDELVAGAAGGEVLLPMRASVAYALITEWFGAALPTAW